MKQLTIIGLIVLLSQACWIKKEVRNVASAKVEEGNLLIKEAYFQKEIPGMQDEETKEYLHLWFEKSEIEGVKLSQLKLGESLYPVKETKEHLKIELRAIKSDKEQNAGSAVLYYSQGELYYEQVVFRVFHKEPVYLP